MLWGPPVVPSDPLDPAFRSDMETWMQKCVNSGVKRIIGGDRTLVLTEVARSNNIDVHPYVNFNSFPRHGSARQSYGWSLDFLRPDVDADEAREIEKGIDHVERINHDKNGKLIKKTSFMSELSDL